MTDLEAKIQEVEQQRDAYVVEVNRQLSFFAGKLAALHELLPPPAPVSPEPAPASEKVKRGKDRTAIAEPMPIEEPHANGVEASA